MMEQSNKALDFPIFRRARSGKLGLAGPKAQCRITWPLCKAKVVRRSTITLLWRSLYRALEKTEEIIGV
jgi:hypothetical protein